MILAFRASDRHRHIGDVDQLISEIAGPGRGDEWVLIGLAGQRAKSEPEGIVEYMFEAAPILPADAFDLRGDIRV